MKKILSSLFMLAPIALLAQQTTFTITGKLKNSPISGQYIYLLYAKDGKNTLDSARVTNGEYVFKGQLPQSGPATLFSVPPMSAAGRSTNTHASIFLEPVSFSITHVDSFSNIITSGSPANTEYTKLKKQLDPLFALEQTLAIQYRESRATGDTATAAKLGQELDSLDHIVRPGILCAYVKGNPASPIALFTLENAFTGDINPDTSGPLFDRLPAAIRNSPDGIAFQKRLEAARVTSIGHSAPDFTQNDTSGRPITLSSFRGSYVLIDFWASWCGPCRMENPNVVATYNKFKSKGFRIIGVSLDRANTKDKWLSAIRQDGLTWTQVSDLRFWNNAVAKLYGVGSIPQNFLLDPGGKIIAKNLRGTDLANKLKMMYKQ